MAHTAFYPGSFDPVTNGHLDIIDRAARIADRLVIGVGVHHGKTPLFSEKERVEMLREALENNNREIRRKIDIVTFKNLTVDAAREQRAQIIIRGLRDAGDFEYEMQMAGMNSAMAPDVETVFLASAPPVRHIAAALVRQIAAIGGDVSPFVPENVIGRLRAKF